MPFSFVWFGNLRWPSSHELLSKCSNLLWHKQCMNNQVSDTSSGETLVIDSIGWWYVHVGLKNISSWLCRNWWNCKVNQNRTQKSEDRSFIITTVNCGISLVSTSLPQRPVTIIVRNNNTFDDCDDSYRLMLSLLIHQ